jgi:hypothetical protein
VTARKRRGDEAGRASESHRHKRFIQGNCAAFHLKCFNAATRTRPIPASGSARRKHPGVLGLRAAIVVTSKGLMLNNVI